MVLSNSPSTLLKHQSGSLHRMHYLMGCFVEIEVSGVSMQKANEAMDATFSEMQRVETMLSRFSEESLTTRLNQLAAREPVKVTSEFFDLIEKCLSFSQISEGAFDITTSPLTQLWGRADQRQQVPAKNEIRKALSKTGSRHIQLNQKNKTVKFDKSGIQIDFGAVGKGYAVDSAIRVLRDCGIEEAFVSTGSNIFILSRRDSLVGIRDPRNSNEVLASIPLKNRTIATSASYERYYEIENQKYSHVICPQTGYPVQHDLLSVSITGPRATECDILSTAAFVMGSTAGRQLIEQTKGYDDYFITSELLI